MKCPHGHYYWAEKETCFQDIMSSLPRIRRSSRDKKVDEKPKMMSRPIFGTTVVSLGDLYDARHDRFLPGTSLWSERTINDSKRTQSQRSSEIKYIAGKTLKERLDEMDISVSMKLNILGTSVSNCNTYKIF